MKRLVFIIAAVLCCTTFSFSQTKSPYLFSDFSEGQITYKNGQYTIEKVNFNLIDGNLYFIDKKDKELKIASPIEQIASIKVGERIFQLSGDGWIELVNEEPELYVQYKTRTRAKARKAAFEGTTTVASVSTYSDFRDGGQQSILRDDDKEITEVLHTYWLVRNGNKIRFTSFKQFVKFYPSKKDVLMQYIADKSIDFENVRAVVSLLKHAQSL